MMIVISYTIFPCRLVCRPIDNGTRKGGYHTTILLALISLTIYLLPIPLWQTLVKFKQTTWDSWIRIYQKRRNTAIKTTSINTYYLFKWHFVVADDLSSLTGLFLSILLHVFRKTVSTRYLYLRNFRGTDRQPRKPRRPRTSGRSVKLSRHYFNWRPDISWELTTDDKVI